MSESGTRTSSLLPSEILDTLPAAHDPRKSMVRKGSLCVANNHEDILISARGSKPGKAD